MVMTVATPLTMMPLLQVDVEPFALYDSTAWKIARAAYTAETSGDVRFNDVTSRRLLLPAYVITYSTFGIELRAVVSGWTGAVWGAQQEVTPRSFASPRHFVTSHTHWSQAATARLLARILSSIQAGFVQDSVAAVLRNPHAARAAMVLLLPLMRGAAKLLFFPPIFVATVLSLGGLFAHATFAPYSHQRRLFQQWEATRAEEARVQSAMFDEWKFRGSSSSNNSSSSNSSSSSSSNSQHTQPRGYPQQRQQQPLRPPSTGLPPVNERDFYAVLGLGSKGTSAATEDVQAAFRRELLKYHPPPPNFITSLLH
jgi:hypothetical protein